MDTWALAILLSDVRDEMEERIKAARASAASTGTKSDGPEAVWLELLNSYLPNPFYAARAHVSGRRGESSERIDIVVFDREHCRFNASEAHAAVSVESVYAVFVTTPVLEADQIAYARQKVRSVRRLQRSTRDAEIGRKVYPRILGGLLAFESASTLGVGKRLNHALELAKRDERLDLGCIASHGMFVRRGSRLTFIKEEMPATNFIFELIGRFNRKAAYA